MVAIPRWGWRGLVEMDLFQVVPIAIAVIFVIVVAGMITHMIMFGTVFGLVVKRFAEVAEQQREALAAQQPEPCKYCGVVLRAEVEECPGCGAKRGGPQA